MREPVSPISVERKLQEARNVHLSIGGGKYVRENLRTNTRSANKLRPGTKETKFCVPNAAVPRTREESSQQHVNTTDGRGRLHDCLLLPL